MPTPTALFRVALPALALGALLALAPALHAQNATERVLRSWTDEVKLDDGATADYTTTITFDARTGEYTRTVTDDKSGQVVARTVESGSLVRPSEEEVRMAREAILNHPEIAPLVASALNPVLSGGFVLYREDSALCGAGSRCLQFDLYDVNDAERTTNRLRYVIVDARDFTVADADFDPRRGNATRFNQ